MIPSQHLTCCTRFTGHTFPLAGISALRTDSQAFSYSPDVYTTDRKKDKTINGM